MNELYWITVLGNLSFLAGMCIFFVVAYVSILLVWRGSIMSYEPELLELFKKTVKKSTTPLICVFLFGIVGTVFIPSKQEMLLIYGVGSTIDYIQSNDKAKQLPDKAVEALSRYLDEINKEDK